MCSVHFNRKSAKAIKMHLILATFKTISCLLFVDILHENQNQSHSFQFVKTFHGACKIGAKLLVPVIRLEINNTNYWHQEGRPLNNFFGKVYLRQDLLRLPVLASLLQAPRSRDLKILTCAEYSG